MLDMSWLQRLQGGMGGGAGSPMTPGAGMPPYQNAPMSMQPPQMAPPSPIPGAPPPGQPPQSPINPAQMGMLSAMLAQNTRKPGDMPPGAMTAAQPLQEPPPGANPFDPIQLGMLSRMLGGGYGGPR